MDTPNMAEHLPGQPPPKVETGSIEKEKNFFPSGAIAFFIALVILCLVIWFGIYFLMLERI